MITWLAPEVADDFAQALKAVPPHQLQLHSTSLPPPQPSWAYLASFFQLLQRQRGIPGVLKTSNTPTNQQQKGTAANKEGELSNKPE